MVRYTTNFTGKGLEKMARLPRLTKADFYGSGISNRGLGELLGTTQLTELNLEACKGFSDAGLAKLTALTKLQTLNVRDTNVTRTGLEAFKKAAPNCQVTLWTASALPRRVPYWNLIFTSGAVSIFTPSIPFISALLS